MLEEKVERLLEQYRQEMIERCNRAINVAKGEEVKISTVNLSVAMHVTVIA